MRCGACGFENPPHHGFCAQCGAALERRCARCDAPNPPQSRYCGRCGQALDAATGDTPRFWPLAASAVPQSHAEDGAAERRQLTVVFSDLIGSTPLAERLDPEELRRIVRAYQQVCRGVVERHGGHVAQYQGDGVIIYFGYPVAHEDSPRRAVRAALDILRGVETLNGKLRQEVGLELGLRLGLHTGEAVVGQISSEGWHAPIAVGETPNLAARIQTMASPNTAVLSAATHRLVAPFFMCEDLGEQALKGIARPVRLYRVLSELDAQMRLAAAARAELTPLVGREKEVQLLLRGWRSANAGEAQWFLLRGEPGIGKSRLVEVLKGALAGESFTLVEGQCSPYLQNSAFALVCEVIRRRLSFRADESSQEKLAKLRALLERRGFGAREVMPLIAPLLGLPLDESYPPLDLTPQRQREKTLETLAAWLVAATEDRPVLFIVEDVHWADPSSLEVLGRFMHQTQAHRLLMVLTGRPEFQAPWPDSARLRRLDLRRLSGDQTAELARLVARDRALPPEVLREVVGRTDGVPLFIEELTKMLLESGLLEEANGGYRLTRPLPAQAIPATVQDSLMARLDRLGEAKSLAQLGAALGRSFSGAVLEAVAQLPPQALKRSLARLVEADLLTCEGEGPQTTHRFKHALIQDTAYQSLLKSTRRQYHQRIAEVLEKQFPRQVENEPEVLAQHFTAAGLPRQAIAYWQKAGQAALARSANPEAIHHFRNGLDLVAGLPEGPERVQQELQLQLAVGMPLLATHGYAAPEVGATFARARELCDQVGAVPQLAPALYGLWSFYLVRCEFQTASEIAAQLLALAEQQGDRELLLEAHTCAGINAFWAKTDLAAARRHLENAVRLYDLKAHAAHALIYSVDPGVASLAHLAWILWLQGLPDQSRQRLSQMRELAQARAHTYSTAYAFAWEAFLWLVARHVHEAKAVAEQGVAFCAEQGFPLWLVVTTFVRDWSGMAEGGGAEAADGIRTVLEAWRATGALVSQPQQLWVLADVYRQLGQIEPGLQTVDAALDLVHRYREEWYEPELLRLRGELHLTAQPPSREQAEADFRESLDVARRQQARSWELRSVLSLARLWRQRGERGAARRLLAEAYDAFTEGFDQPDQQEARQLLADWHESPQQSLKEEYAR